MIKQKLKDYFFNNPIKTMTFIMSLIGGLVFVVYFMSIKYMPVFNFDSAIVLLFFIALTGMLLFLGMALLLSLPGFLWAEVYGKNSEILPQISENEEGKVALFFTAPIIIFYSILTLSFSFSENSEYRFIVLTIALTLIVIFLAAFVSAFKQCLIKFVVKNPKKEIAWLCFASILSAFISLLTFMVLIPFFQKIPDATKLIDVISIVVMLCLLTLVANVIVSVLSKKLITKVMVSCALVVAILMVSQSHSMISAAVMKIYKLGHFTVKTIALNESGCYVLQSFGVKNITSDAAFPDYCSADNVKVLSRLGKESYLDMEGKQFPMNNDFILSWVVESSFQEKEPSAEVQ